MANEPGRLLASGRDSDIFEFGPGLVLRRARDGRSMAFEAAVMDHAHRHGYPVPAVQELRAGGTELVMDRVDGPHLLAAIGNRPWRLWALAGALADLHTRLHALPVPDIVPVLQGDGTALLHLDLHPLNVIMSRTGPVVIDWPNAMRGHAGTDVADTWLVLSTAELPDRSIKSRLLGAARTRFVNAFLAHFDRDEVRRGLPAAAERRIADHNHTDVERARMQAFLDRYAPS